MNNPVADTTSGKVVGLVERDVAIFRGIAYGAPVGGDRRFQPPDKPVAWRGIREAQAFGESAPHARWTESTVVSPIRGGWVAEPGGAPPEGENCLVANVWTPEVGPGDRPVMVFFHGGGYHLGSGSGNANDGTNLARLGDVVVVSFNHRLGPLGYLYLAEFGDERFADSGNAGTLDILLALRWVKENITAFGGDPDKVTLFGFSGGSAKVSSMLALPDAPGLFSQAICHSGVDVLLRRPDVSAELADRLLHRLGVPTTKLDLLFDLPAEQILDSARQLRPAAYERNEFWPVVDGRTFTQDPVDAVKAGSAAGIRFIIGTMAQETAGLMAYDEKTGTLDHHGLFGHLPDLFGDDTDRLLEVYRSEHPEMSETELFIALTTDRVRVPSVRFAEAKLAGGGEPVYMYVNRFRHPFGGGIYGAVHGLDGPITFDNCHVNRFLADDEPANTLGHAIAECWTSFAWTGASSGSGLPAWPAYSTDRRSTMIIDGQWSVEDDPGGVERRAWDGFDLAGAGLVSRTTFEPDS